MVNATDGTVSGERSLLWSYSPLRLSVVAEAKEGEIAYISSKPHWSKRSGLVLWVALSMARGFGRRRCFQIRSRTPSEVYSALLVAEQIVVSYCVTFLFLHHQAVNVIAFVLPVGDQYILLETFNAIL